MDLNTKLVVVFALLLLMLPAVCSARTHTALAVARKRVPPSGPSNKGHGAPRRSSARHLLRLHSHELHVGIGVDVRALRVASADA